MDVAVLGGTGTIGRVVVQELAERGHDVRVLSRRPAAGPGTHFPVDLRTGEGLAESLAGTDVVVDASNPASPRKDAAAAVLVEGTRNLLEAELAAGIGHHVQISIVGIEAIPYAYHRLKVQQERAVAESGLSWSV
ncbi:MAG TPA: NAD(P)H-binding protein, partial [Actinomycetota bacterium]|nr:NAD(P)H-binding protein [Actinomycetota bacterium]